MELKKASEEDKELWNQLVDRSAHSTLFHRWEFLKIVEKHTGSKLYPMIGYKGTTPVGVYPVFLQRKPFTNIITSPPSGALLLYLGPLLADQERLKQSTKESLFLEMQKEMNRFIEGLKYNYARIRPAPRVDDARPFQWTGYKVEPLYTYILDLSKGADSVWKSIGDTTRVSVIKARKKGVTVREGGKSDLEFVRKLVAERLCEQGHSTNDYRKYLEDVFDTFHPGNFRIFIGEYDGKPVGGVTLICYKGRASFWLGMPKTELKGVYPNDLIMWESMQWACQNGYKEYELMCAGDDPRLRHFKSKFNPELTLWYSAEKYSSAYYSMLEKAFTTYKRLVSK